MMRCWACSATTGQTRFEQTDWFIDLELLSYTFFQHALIGVVLVSLVAAIIGSYIVARRMVFIAGGITHACFGGLGFGFWAGLNPVVCAGVVAVMSGIGVEWLSDRHRVREDSAIGVIWALGMAVGTLFIFLTPGFTPELNSFLFGNILTITLGDLIAIAVYLAVLAVVLAVWYNKLVMSAFDADFGKTRSVNVGLVNMAGTVFVAIAIVLMIRLAGVMLLISLITLPQMIAESFTRRLPRMICYSAIASLMCAIGGLFASAAVGVPASSAIVVLLVLAFVAARIFRRFFCGVR